MASNLGTVVNIGVDIGGTFTDFVAVIPDAGKILSYKLASTPEDPATAVLDGINALVEMIENEWQITPSSLEITHGSTVATNALLERKGARTALITTRGFRDVLEIGRQNRPHLYDLLANPAPPLVPVNLRFEVSERVDYTGHVQTPLESRDLEGILLKLEQEGVESVAISLLFSFLHPDHEIEISKNLEPKGYFISRSSEILPEFREYERTSTTTVNAYVSPIMDRYLEKLWTGLSGMTIPARMRIMQSNGGEISLAEATRAGVRCIMSGPAGGIVGARSIASQAFSNPVPESTGVTLGDRVRIITFDMGGTSTDVSLIDDEPEITTEAEIGGCPIHIPMIDIHTIGAGGGSIASVDAGGALRVGPQSAGAVPGPACYGLGELKTLHPTVTDANVVLGRLPVDYFLGGKMKLFPERARLALQKLGETLGMDEVSIALGVIEVVNSHMERALRVISVERGHDPEGYTLVSFGGAGGLHASNLARRLGIKRILVPPLAATLSGFGMAVADVIRDYSRTVMLPGGCDPSAIREVFRSLEESGVRDLDEEGIPASDQEIHRMIDLRYVGQAYEITIPFTQDYESAFHQAHNDRYGYSRPESPIEIVTVRLRVFGRRTMRDPVPLPAPQNSAVPDPIDRRPVYLSDRPQIVPVYLGERLKPGDRLAGPAIVARTDTTILLEIGDICEIDQYRNLRITTGK